MKDLPSFCLSVILHRNISEYEVPMSRIVMYFVFNHSIYFIILYM